MSIQLQMRRGTTAQVGAFTGAAGEITVDLSYMRGVLHDGVTVGGWPMEKAELTLVNDVNYSVLPTDVVVMYTAKTAARTVTLPSVFNYPPGQRLTILDGVGNSTTFNLIVVTQSSTEKFLSGNSTTFTINFSTTTSFGRLSLMHNNGLGTASIVAGWIALQ